MNRCVQVTAAVRRRVGGSGSSDREKSSKSPTPHIANAPSMTMMSEKGDVVGQSPPVFSGGGHKLRASVKSFHSNSSAPSPVGSPGLQKLLKPQDSSEGDVESMRSRISTASSRKSAASYRYSECSLARLLSLAINCN